MAFRRHVRWFHRGSIFQSSIIWWRADFRRFNIRIAFHWLSNKIPRRSATPKFVIRASREMDRCAYAALMEPDWTIWLIFSAIKWYTVEFHCLFEVSNFTLICSWLKSLPELHANRTLAGLKENIPGLNMLPALDLNEVKFPFDWHLRKKIGGWMFSFRGFVYLVSYQTTLSDIKKHWP